MAFVCGGGGFLYYASVLVIYVTFSTVTKTNDVVFFFQFDYGSILLSIVAEFLGAAVAINIVDRLGRVPSIFSGYMFGGLLLTTLCYGNALGLSRWYLLPLAIGARLFIMSGVCITSTATAELLSTEIRTTGQSVVTAVGDVAGAMSVLVAWGPDKIISGGILLVISVTVSAVATLLPETAWLAMGTTMDGNNNKNNVEEEFSFKPEAPSREVQIVENVEE